MQERLHIDLTKHQQTLLNTTIPEALDYAAEHFRDDAAIKVIEGTACEHTWGELRALISGLRSGLEGAGIRPGDKVGIILGNGIEFPVTWLAVIEAGAVAVPMNPRYTQPEVDFVLGDADATWLVATAETAERLSHDGHVGPVPMSRVVVVSTDPVDVGLRWSDLLATAMTPRTHRARVHDVVNIQFTSGTTGMPKGCLLTHEYWIDFGVYSSGLFDQPKRLLADHPFYYMQNQAYFWIALAGAGALYVTQGLSRRKFMGWLHDHQIDFAWVDDFMLEEPEHPSDKLLAMSKAPIAGLPGEVHRALEQRFGFQARDWYASTEAGNGTFVPWERNDLVGVETIGLAWPTRESKIIDAEGLEVPAGSTGELCLRGRGMMLGYHNRPDANAELMLPGGWFRTGDLVRKDDEGLHYFQGRLKDMVKRSGENISCAEVEMRIQALPEVFEVGVVAVPDRDRGEEVKAVVVLQSGAELSATRIEQWCREGLAAFKVPRYVEFRAELPHTASGKIAKAELRAEADPTGKSVVDLRPSSATTIGAKR